MTATQPVLLIIDDNEMHQRILHARLTGCVVIQAFHYEDAIPQLLANLDTVTHILLDGTLPLKKLELGEYVENVATRKGWHLVAQIRETGFKGPIAAFSNHPGDQDRLVAAGCVVRIDKEVLPMDNLVPVQQFLST